MNNSDSLLWNEKRRWVPFFPITNLHAHSIHLFFMFLSWKRKFNSILLLLYWRDIHSNLHWLRFCPCHALYLTTYNCIQQTCSPQGFFYRTWRFSIHLCSCICCTPHTEGTYNSNSICWYVTLAHAGTTYTNVNLFGWTPLLWTSSQHE